MSYSIFGDIAQERQRQDARWGEQNHPDGTGCEEDRAKLEEQRHLIDDAMREGQLTWSHILLEEVAEAFAESDIDLLRTELIQVAAVAIAWIQAIDRRT